MADSTRAAIRTKVRRLTRSPSVSQITNTQINEKINTVLKYNLPSEVKLFTLRKTFSFFTTPNVDTYDTNTQNVNDPMFNFKNAVILSSSPVFIAGYQVRMIQDRSQFFLSWPVFQQKVIVGTGDGVTTNFTGTLANKPVTPRHLLFSSEATNGVGQQLQDVPLVSTGSGQAGVELFRGNMYDPRGVVPTKPTIPISTNTINYFTGVFNITFSDAPATGKDVTIQAVPYVAGRPISILFFDNTFTVRPIPDDNYEVKIEVSVPGTELTDDTESPDLEQWWQWIAYATSKLIFEERMDLESVQMILPQMKEQELFILRRTLDQISETRAPTIYNNRIGTGHGLIWPLRSFT